MIPVAEMRHKQLIYQDHGTAGSTGSWSDYCFGSRSLTAGRRREPERRGQVAAGWVTAAGSLREAQVSAGAPATTPRGASGMARSRTPHALKMALAMAGATAMIGVSPPPADG